MKKTILTIHTLVLSAAFGAGAGTVRIMPVGDSITYGQGWDPHGGYRAVLREKLAAAGYSVDYVGTQTGNQGTLSGAGDGQHEGHPGWSVERFVTAFPEWSAKIDAPHLILLKAGTNNCNGNHDTVMSQVCELLDEIKTLQPSAHVICGTLIPFLNGSEVGSNDAWVRAHNELLKSEVARRRAAGDRISLADLYPVVSPTEGMSDDRHPNETGYRAMADVWFDAITSVFPDPAADFPEPDLTAVRCEIDGETGDKVTIWFNGRIGNGADSPDCYMFGDAYAPESFAISQDRRSVEMTAARPAQAGVKCTVAVSGVESETGVRTVVPASFDFHFLPYGAKYYVPEAGLYRKVYGFTFPNSAGYDSTRPSYDFDDHANVGAYTRVAYYIELQKEGEEMQYMWVSMDKFTDDPGRIAIPTRFALSEEKEILQQFVYNMKVASNVPGVTSGDKERGNIEFWPYSYFGTPKLGIEWATDSYDVDDSCNLSGNFACMQIHDTDALTPLFCFNNWGTGGGYDLGLGARQGSGNTDWTQSNTSGSWNKRRIMEIYVLEDVNDETVPAFVSGILSESRRSVDITFDNPVADGPGLASGISFTGGIEVKSVERDASNSRVLHVACSYVAKPSEITVSVSGLHAANPRHTAIPAFSFALSGEDEVSSWPAAPKAVTDLVPDAAGFAHLYTIDIQPSMRLNVKDDGYNYVNRVDPDAYADCHTVDNSASAPEFFSRVGYLLELVDANDATNWVWTAFDAFSGDFADIDIPTADASHPDGGHVNGRYVSNLDVASNVDGIMTGTGIETGLIEFSPWDYGSANKRDVPNATGSYDFGDDLYKKVGDYACMQVANYAAEQMIWTVGRFNGRGVCVGIGNCPNSEHIDYTFENNAGKYKSRTLYVLVKPDYDADVSTDYEPVRAVAALDRKRVAVSFKSPVLETAAQPRYYSVSGASVAKAEVSQIDGRDVILTLDEPLAPGSSYTVETLFPKSANKTMAIYTERALPAALLAGVEEIGDYVLLNDLTVPYNWNAARDGVDYRTDESRFGFGGRKIERIAYALEIEYNEANGGEYKWAWVSMDPFTDDPAKMGVPTIVRGIHFQTYVDNISVRAGSSTGTAPIPVGEWERGNIEFTPSNYGSENSLDIPGASGSAFDFGDRLYGGPDQAGHGCMQIHNYIEKEMILGVTCLGNGMVPSLLVGFVRDDGGNITGDGTYNNNRHQMTTHELRVFVKLAAEEPVSGDKGVGPAFLVQPRSQHIKYSGGERTRAVTLDAYAPAAVSYQWRKNGVDVEGATGPVLEIEAMLGDNDVYSVVAFGDDGSYTTSSEASVVFAWDGLRVIVR